MTAAVSAFIWTRVRPGWRPLLVAYPLIMAFTLVYTAEHYVVDVLLGWVLAAVVIAATRYLNTRRATPSATELPPVVTTPIQEP